MENMAISCIQCGTEFEFSINEQLHYKEMNFDDPKRCPSCRKRKSRPSSFQDKKFNNKKRYYQLKNEYRIKTVRRLWPYEN
jgi:DNA-directed RNA polymerase subunit RPC12/RpoP